MSAPKRKLTLNQSAILRFCWKVNQADKEALDKFFLLKDSWERISPDFTEDEVEYKRYLFQDGHDFEVILLEPVRVLRAAKELGLSFRLNLASGLKVVLIKSWQEASIAEIVTNGR